MANKTKTKRINNKGYQSEDQNEIKHFLIIIAIIIVGIVVVYFFTRLFVSKDLFNDEKEEQITSGSINYDTTLIGSMLSKPEEEYFVIIYDSKASDAIYYSLLVSNYNQNTDVPKIYTADLSNGLNSKYLGTEEHAKTENFAEFKVNGPTLLMIKKGKVEKVYTTKEEMNEALKVDEKAED